MGGRGVIGGGRQAAFHPRRGVGRHQHGDGESTACGGREERAAKRHCGYGDEQIRRSLHARQQAMAGR